MFCGWIVFCFLLATVSADSEGNPPSEPSPIVTCNFSSGQSLRQCGDDFFHASLCLKCGCCFETHSYSCFFPPGLVNTFQLSPNCTRSFKSLLGQVLLLNDGPSQPQSPVTFYILLERYSPHLRISLRAFGSSAVELVLLPFSNDAKDLPTSVKQQFRDLESGAEPFFFSYANVTYPVPDVYDVHLLIQSHDRLDSVSFNSMVSVTSTGILSTALLQSAVFVNRGPYTVGEESILAIVLDDIHPDIELTLDFDDDSGIARRGSLSFLFGAFPEKPGYACIFAHRYSTGGEYVAKAILHNPNPKLGISRIRLTTTIRIKCSLPRVEATGGNISASGAVKKKRSQTLVFKIRVIQDCTDQPVVTQWSLFLVNPDESVAESMVMTDRRQTSESEVKLPPYTLDYGLYTLKITGRVPYHNPQGELVITETIWFQVVTSRPVAIIDGPLLAGDWQIITFNSSKSYDPDVNWQLKSSLLVYTWYCLIGRWNLTMVQQQMEMSFRHFEGCYYPGCLCHNQTNTLTHPSFLMNWPHDDYYRQVIPTIYTVALHLQTFNNRSAYAFQSVMFFSNDSISTVTNQVTIPIHLIAKIPDVDIACVSNCLGHVDHTEPLALYAYCRNCLIREQLTYEWDFQSANESFTLKGIDWISDTLTGNQKASLIVNAKTFENITEDESYQFFVTVTRLSGRQAKVGFSFYFAKYNTDFSMGASKDNRGIRIEQQLHRLLVVLFVLKFYSKCFTHEICLIDFG